MTDWRTRAACRDSETEYWFADEKNYSARLMLDAARAVCNTCPVTTECLTFAVDGNDQYGMFGGYTADERRRHTRRPKQARQRRTTDRPYNTGTLYDATCDHCGDPYGKPAAQPRRRYCGPDCAQAAHRVTKAKRLAGT